MNNTKQDYIIVKGVGGLGNRILAALTGALNSELTNRKLLIDWRDSIYSAEGENASDYLFSRTDSIILENISNNDSVYPTDWQNRLDLSLLELIEDIKGKDINDPSCWKYSRFDVTRLEHKENVLVFWAFTQYIFKLRKYFETYKPDYVNKNSHLILRELFEKYFQPNEKILSEVDSYCLQENISDCTGIHIRYTDKKIDLKRSLNKLDEIQEANPGRRIFLCTDSTEIIQMMQLRYKNVFVYPKWVPETEIPIHCRRTKNPDRLKHAEETLIEIYLLAKCRELILDTSSTFAYIVTLITAEDTIVHDFKPLKMLPDSLRNNLWLIAHSIKYLMRKSIR